MSTPYSQSVEDFREFENCGARVMYERARQHLERCRYADRARDRCERHQVWLNDVESEHEPMMLYVYPLAGEPSDEQIAAVCAGTACTVLERQYRDGEGSGEFFLALRGGGMDLSQDVALAYVLAGEPIPDALAVQVSTQCGLSKHGQEWRRVMHECKRSMHGAARGYRYRIRQITDALRGERTNAQRRTPRARAAGGES
jgi:hypothetical protein